MADRGSRQGSSGNDANLERLQKLLARAGVASRRAAEELIREGRVTVNGRKAQVGDKVDSVNDAVKVDGRRIQPSPERRYILVNKPVGVISTVSDPEGRDTVLDLLPQGLRRGLVPVGRLDFDSEGLLLLTDDGDLALHVAHPRYGCRKTYQVKVKGRPTAATLDKLRQGIVLYGKTTAPAGIEAHIPPKGVGARESTANSWWQVLLGEGRTRQIREMFFRAGHPVSRLRRVAIGTLRDDTLPPGGWRELTVQEVESLREQTRKVRRRERPPRRRPSGTKSSGASGARDSSQGTSPRGERRPGARGTGPTGGGRARRGGSPGGASRRSDGPSRSGPGRGGSTGGSGRRGPGGDRRGGSGGGRGGSGQGGSGRGGGSRGGGRRGGGGGRGRG